MKIKANDGCSFCALAAGDEEEHKTEWFYVGHSGVVVEDLNPKGAALRLLAVPKEHFPVGSEPQAVRWWVLDVLWGIGLALCLERGLKMARVDKDDHSYKDHWHAQMYLEEK